MSLGSLCNNDYDGNESVQKVTGLISKTTIMHAHVTSLFHCCRSMTKTWNVLTRRFKQPEKTVDILRRHHWFPRENDVWATSVEIPFWWRVTTHIWALLLIGWKLLSQHDQSEALRLPKRVREISSHLIKFSSGISNNDSRNEHKYGIIKQQTIFAQILIKKKYLLGELLTSLPHRKEITVNYHKMQTSSLSNCL